MIAGGFATRRLVNRVYCDGCGVDMSIPPSLRDAQSPTHASKPQDEDNIKAIGTDE